MLKLSIKAFPFSKQRNFDLPLLNSGFHDFEFSSDRNIFPDEDFKFLFH